MAKVIKAIAKYAVKIVKKWGPKALGKITGFVKKNWKTVAKWVAEWAIWEVIEKIADKLGL